MAFECRPAGPERGSPGVSLGSGGGYIHSMCEASWWGKWSCGALPAGPVAAVGMHVERLSSCSLLAQGLRSIFRREQWPWLMF